VGVGGRGGIKHVVITFWNMFQICKFFPFLFGVKHVFGIKVATFY
jgi:hypothetical protein